MGLMRMLLKVTLIVLSVYFLASFVSGRVGEDEVETGGDVVRFGKPVFYFSLLPRWYDGRMATVRNGILKKQGIALMRQGMTFDQWLSYQQEAEEISKLPGLAEFASLKYITEKNDILKQIDHLEQSLSPGDIDPVRSGKIKAIVAQMDGIGLFDRIPEVHFWGSDNVFQQSFISFLSDGQKLDQLAMAFRLSFILSIFAFVFSTTGGTGLALWYISSKAGIRWLFRTVLQILYVLPVFCLAVIAVQFFTSSYYSPYINWFPGPGSFLLLGGSDSSWQILFEQGHYLVLPALITSVPLSAGIALRWISGMEDEQKKPYVTTLRSKGLSTSRINGKHVLKNISLPMIIYFGLLFPALMSGVFLIENVFAIGGIGRLSYQSVRHDDLMMLMMITALVAGINIVFNKGSRRVMRWADPRLKTPVI